MPVSAAGAPVSTAFHGESDEFVDVSSESVVVLSSCAFVPPECIVSDEPDVTERAARGDETTFMTVDEVLVQGRSRFPGDETTVLPRADGGVADGAPHPRSLVTRSSRSDTIFRGVSYAAGGTTVAIMLAVGIFLSIRAGDALSVAGFSFLTEQEWSPETGRRSASRPCCSARSRSRSSPCACRVPLALGTALLIAEIAPGGSSRRW